MPRSGNTMRSGCEIGTVMSPNVYAGPSAFGLGIAEAGQCGQLALIEEQPLAVVAPVVLDVAGALERDHVLVALVAARGGRAALVRRDHAALDDVLELELLDDVVLALVGHGPAASAAAIDLDDVDLGDRHLVRTCGALHGPTIIENALE